jgi:hypothetical protein
MEMRKRKKKRFMCPHNWKEIFLTNSISGEDDYDS